MFGYLNERVQIANKLPLLNGQRREPIAHFLAYWNAKGRARCGARPVDRRCCGAGRVRSGSQAV